MKRWYMSVVLSGLALSPVAYAQVDRGHEFEDETKGPHESGATGPHLALPAERSAAGWVVLEGFTSIQVNLDENGMNVVGDAANEPSIAVDPTAPNRIVVGWRQFPAERRQRRQAGYSRSLDGGRTWTPIAVVDPGVFRSDPVLRADSTGRIYYIGITIDPWRSELFISEDGGVSWSQPISAFGYDKPWIAVDRTGGPGDGNLYQAWNSRDGDPSFSRMLAGEMTWNEAWSYFPDSNFAPILGTVEVGPDGEVVVLGWEPCCDGPLWVVRTSDAQFADVSPPTFEAFVVPPPSNRRFVGRTPTNSGASPSRLSIAGPLSPHPGRLYVLATTESTSLRSGAPITSYRYGLSLTWSDDTGESWSTPIDVTGLEADGQITWFGTMDVSPSGRIDVAFNDNRDEIDSIFVATTRFTSSSDGGQTWTTPRAIGPSWLPFDGGGRNPGKIGDYYDIVSDDVGAHLIYATTYNGEHDVYYVRIGDYDCNANGVGDAIDIANGDAQDCNANGIPDSCEIAAGAEIDDDGNGIPDRCECPADLDRDLDIDSDDFFFYLDLFAAGDDGADVDGDGDVDAEDFTVFLEMFAQGCP